MHVVRDLLDTKVIDRNGRELGRVDGIILELRAGRPPRMVAIELGLSVLGRRVRPFLGRWAAGLERAMNIDQGRPMRIPIEAIIDITDHVRVDLTAGDTAATTLEHRLRNAVSSLPGTS